MKIHKTKLDGLYILCNDIFTDNRGLFHKTFSKDCFKDMNLDTEFKEIYYSYNKKWSLRGLHFQIPPYDHTKLVYVSRGCILDVVVDIRKNSPTYGEYVLVKLNDTDGLSVYIPSGFAHGFLSIEDGTIVNYAQTSCYNKECDSGININSISIDWGIDFIPIQSERDLSFISLKEFVSPFGL